ncbi:hypothetical protein B0O99DRAFT_520416 [Bisporella sp. PMI_857]|nr:hypothetical protein B0O99DRAFT_520416 [Bisporella sp. PMI_857]
MEKDRDTVSPPQKKYMRYKSVQNAGNGTSSPVVSPEKKSDNEPPVIRSMSRYRRPKRHDPVLSPPLPSVPLPQSHPQMSPTKSGTRRVTDPVSNSTGPQKQQLPIRHETVAGHKASPARRRETEEERVQRKAREARVKEDQYKRAQKGKEAQELQKIESEAETARRLEEEAAQLLAEQKRKDLERLEKELEAAALKREPSPPKEKLGFFSRKRGATMTAPTPSLSTSAPVTSPPLPGNRSASSSSAPTKADGSPARTINSAGKKGIEQGGGGIVPQTDAPISASNAGERRVLIRCKQSSITLPITPETTPMDLVYSAANIMTQNISPTTAILLESYTQLGLERRIRRYEHIRDIMNSWDRDTQNALILENSDSPNFDIDLEASSVPKKAPKDVTVFMYHSQKPGKWNKRYITLLESGQIFMSKKNGIKPTDKDAQSLCHLSDFDIYTPTPQQIRKSLRPPKRHCFAVKSQQRTTMFLNTENFVHFFCTDMEEIAQIWYNAVQSWRSYYLVNKLGEGKTAAKNKTIELIKRPRSKTGPSHRVKVSVDEDPYTIGSFKPLLDMSRFDHKPEATEDSEEENRPLQIPFHLRNGIPAQPVLQSRPPPVTYRLPPEANEEEFSSSGLLGRTYSQRQKAQREREEAEKQKIQPPTAEPSAFVPSGHHRTQSVKTTRTGKRPATSAGASTSLQRNATTKEKPKPLLDFTPQFKEAPQWDKTGKGQGVAAPAGVLHLVEAATTPENPLLDIPSKAAVFRREVTTGRRPATSSASAASSQAAFVKGGLVSGN